MNHARIEVSTAFLHVRQRNWLLSREIVTKPFGSVSFSRRIREFFPKPDVEPDLLLENVVRGT